MAAALGSNLMTKVFTNLKIYWTESTAHLTSQVLSHSKAEQIVRPLWEKLEDFCVYGLLLVGVILIPHAIVLGTPIYCTYCQVERQKNKKAKTKAPIGAKNNS